MTNRTQTAVNYKNNEKLAGTNNLSFTIIQSSIIWESVEENLIEFEKKILQSPANSEIIILPEMFSTGFSMRTKELAEDYNGKTVNWLKKMASENKKTIVGSIINKENGQFTNRLLWVNPEGNIKYYDKRHLFRMGNEHNFYAQGEKQLIVDHGKWRIMPLICYDLRFPVWSRNRNNYDLLIYIANWPEPRREVWKTLLKARAIENQAWVIGVNRIGSDGMNLNYSGDSMVVDFKGIEISNIPANEDYIYSSEISLSELREFRKKFPAYLDADNFDLHYD
ncbi:MAG: amidohydrolase [Bacteroidales bacterium]|nr:amidohydrolase [Bacteroidales bacterium]